MKKLKLKSGADLDIGDAPFPAAKALFKAFLTEAKHVQVVKWDEMHNVLKDVFCTAFASDLLENRLWPCIERCRYNGQTITEATFESMRAREDYVEICYLVAQENLLPFTKSLYAKFKEVFEKIENIPA